MKINNTTKNSKSMNIPDEIYKIARIVRDDWKNIYFGAVPYLDAMASIEDIEADYLDDRARNIVSYFLANAHTWRGDTAKAVKAKLKEIISQVQ